MRRFFEKSEYSIEIVLIHAGTAATDADTQQIGLVGTAESDDGNEGFGNGNDPRFSVSLHSLSGGETLRSDYSKDGEANLLDFELQAVEIKSATPDPDLFDENGDGEVNDDGRNIWVGTHASTWSGDAYLITSSGVLIVIRCESGGGSTKRHDPNRPPRHES